eukprot:1646865-Prymnesium_polylepis.1
MRSRSAALSLAAMSAQPRFAMPPCRAASPASAVTTPTPVSGASLSAIDESSKPGAATARPSRRSAAKEDSSGGARDALADGAAAARRSYRNGVGSLKLHELIAAWQQRPLRE